MLSIAVKVLIETEKLQIVAMRNSEHLLLDLDVRISWIQVELHVDSIVAVLIYQKAIVEEETIVRLLAIVFADLFKNVNSSQANNQIQHRLQECHAVL